MTVVQLMVILFIPVPYFFDALFGAYKVDVMAHMGLSDTQYSIMCGSCAISAVTAGPIGLAIARTGVTRSALAFAPLVWLGAIARVYTIQERMFVMAVLACFLMW